MALRFEGGCRLSGPKLGIVSGQGDAFVLFSTFLQTRQHNTDDITCATPSSHRLNCIPLMFAALQYNAQKRTGSLKQQSTLALLDKGRGRGNPFSSRLTVNQQSYRATVCRSRQRVGRLQIDQPVEMITFQHVTQSFPIFGNLLYQTARFLLYHKNSDRNTYPYIITSHSNTQHHDHK